MTRRFLTAAIFLAATVSLSACGGSSDGGSEGPGRVAILMADGPTDQYERMLVSVDEITLIGAGGQVAVYDGPAVTFDLLQMSEWADLAFNAKVAAGTYNKIRLGLTQVELIDTDTGETLTLDRLPANGKIDLNPRGPFEVSPDFTTVIKLDMDAKRSFQVVETGNEDLRLRPIVFVEVYQGDLLLPDRLVRVFGTVEAGSIQTGQAPALLVESFRLCDLQFISQTGGPTVGDPDECVRVVADGASVFDDAGEEVGSPAVAEGELLTAVGFVADSDDDESLFDLSAVVLELGNRQPDDPGGWGTTKGAATSDPAACDLDQCFDFDPEGSDPVIVTRLQPGTRVFRADGTELAQSDIGAGDAASVDALPVGTEQNAALVVLANEVAGDTVSGTLTSVDEQTAAPYTILNVDPAPDPAVAVCVNPETEIVQVLADNAVITLFDVLDPAVLETGSLIEAFGDAATPVANCDFLADLVVVESPGP
ncbi:MAG: DUF4382 domain-containing protein [Gammaproteobacteria bacterium]|jgi:hypothetical protein